MKSLATQKNCLWLVVGFVLIGVAFLLIVAPATFAAGSAKDTDSGYRTGPVADFSWSKVENGIMSFLYDSMHSRERMLQVACIGVLIGLYIMMRK